MGHTVDDMTAMYEAYGELPRHSVDCLVALGKLADKFKSDEITAARFVVLAGAELTRLLQEAGAIY